MKRVPVQDVRVDNVVRVGRRTPILNRIAMVSVHTSPLEIPGVGDAGGLNVYVVELSRRLAALGTKVEIFTRATSRSQPMTTEMAPGILVRHVIAGPFEGLAKTDLPGQLCTFAREVLRIEAAYEPGYYDLIHAHYWLSGQVGALARDRWGVPLVHSMHTMAKVKNDLLAEGDEAEPASRVIGEQQVVDAADLIIANTVAEGQQLVDLYGAPADRVRVINPGVDLSVFCPGDQATARARVGFAPDALVLMFAGRLQPLKAPDILVKIAAEMLVRQPELRSRLVVAIIGGSSGAGIGTPEGLLGLATRLGVADVVRLVPPVGREELADFFRAASVVCVPSYNESFGLVALEAQACGTPVVAANVGGLPTAVRDGVSGFLVDGHRPGDYAAVVEGLMREPRLLVSMRRACVEHAASFGWDRTAEQTLLAYHDAHELTAPKPMAAAQ